MAERYAKDFSEILSSLSDNEELRNRVSALIKEKSIPGKVTEEPDRLSIFREILIDLVNGAINDLEAAYRIVEQRIPKTASKYAGDNRVFPGDWAERLIRTQLSRFYNQAVMEELIEIGESDCFVHHSSLESPTTRCSQLLAGRRHSVRTLYDRLIKNYERGDWDNELKIPNHPHYTHIVSPC
jgi:hypothetical protein